MRLSEYSDYSLRVLMCCAQRHEQPRDEPLTIGEIAAALKLSKNHLMKIVNALARQGLLQTTRGRGGGIRLRKPAAAIRIGDVLRESETDFRLVECFDPAVDQCSLSPACGLQRVLRQALKAYFDELDAVTLADITLPDAPAGCATAPRVMLPPRSRRTPA